MAWSNRVFSTPFIWVTVNGRDYFASADPNGGYIARKDQKQKYIICTAMADDDDRRVFAKQGMLEWVTHGKAK